MTLDQLRRRSKRLLSQALEHSDWKVRFKAIRLILGKGDELDDPTDEDADERARLAKKAEETLRSR